MCVLPPFSISLTDADKSFNAALAHACCKNFLPFPHVFGLSKQFAPFSPIHRLKIFFSFIWVSANCYLPNFICPHTRSIQYKPGRLSASPVSPSVSAFTLLLSVGLNFLLAFSFWPRHCSLNEKPNQKPSEAMLLLGADHFSPPPSPLDL